MANHNPVESIISDLSVNLRCALDNMEHDLAYSINSKIDELIEYKTGVKAKHSVRKENTNDL